MIVIVILCVAALFGWWASSIAERKGRSKGAWFMLGFAFGLWSVIIVSCLSRLDDEGYAERRAI